MKKIYLSLIAVLSVCQFSYAQNTYPFPANGSVGIGTSSPAALLDLGNSGSIKQLIYGSGGDVGYYMGFGINLGQAPNTLTAFIGPPGGDGVSGNPSFSIASATTTWPYSAYTTKFTVLSTGNTGIGTTAPQSNLEINNGSYSSGNQLIESGAEPSRYYGVMETTVIAGHTVFSLGLKSNYTNYFQTLNLVNNNIGIGTANPDQKLTVKGTIHSLAVIVDNNIVPDYVFKKDYKLASLKDVKAYIDKNHHLQEMPSANTVARKGLNLGEMNTLLLKKVEELTLYLIEKEQQLKEQETKNNEQQADINELKKQMALMMKHLNK